MPYTLRNKKHKAWQWGVWAEWYGALWLRLKGYRILERRFKTPVGEVDLIVSKADVISFVEVKYRPTVDEAAFAITPHQQQRIVRAAQFYGMKNPKIHNRILRFDALLISKKGWIQHLKNAWQS